MNIFLFSKFKQSIRPFNIISILKCTWSSNFTFFWIGLPFIKYFTKLLFFSGPELSKNSSFVKYLINSKQIQKNVKFYFQVHFNMEIMLNCRIDCLNFENKNMFILQIGPYVHRRTCLNYICHHLFQIKDMNAILCLSYQLGCLMDEFRVGPMPIGPTLVRWVWWPSDLYQDSCSPHQNPHEYVSISVRRDRNVIVRC